MRLILNFKLPTWNQLLAMNHWQRKRVRDCIKNVVCESIQKEKDLQTLTTSPVKVFLTELQKQDYYQMIVPNSSKKFHFHKSIAKKMKR